MFDSCKLEVYFFMITLLSFTCAECPHRTFGPGCSSTCHCSGDMGCDSETGFCDIALCRKGWAERSCSVYVGKDDNNVPAIYVFLIILFIILYVAVFTYLFYKSACKPAKRSAQRRNKNDAAENDTVSHAEQIPSTLSAQPVLSGYANPAFNIGSQESLDNLPRLKRNQDMVCLPKYLQASMYVDDSDVYHNRNQFARPISYPERESQKIHHEQLGQIHKTRPLSLGSEPFYNSGERDYQRTTEYNKDQQRNIDSESLNMVHGEANGVSKRIYLGPEEESYHSPDRKHAYDNGMSKVDNPINYQNASNIKITSDRPWTTGVQPYIHGINFDYGHTDDIQSGADKRQLGRTKSDPMNRELQSGNSNEIQLGVLYHKKQLDRAVSDPTRNTYGQSYANDNSVKYNNKHNRRYGFETTSEMQTRDTFGKHFNDTNNDLDKRVIDYHHTYDKQLNRAALIPDNISYENERKFTNREQIETDLVSDYPPRGTNTYKDINTIPMERRIGAPTGYYGQDCPTSDPIHSIGTYNYGKSSENTEGKPVTIYVEPHDTNVGQNRAFRKDTDVPMRDMKMLKGKDVANAEADNNPGDPMRHEPFVTGYAHWKSTTV